MIFSTKIVRAEPLLQQHLHDVQLGLIDRLLVKSEKDRHDFYGRMFDEDFAHIFKVMNRHDARIFDITSSDNMFAERLLGSVETVFGSHSVYDKTRELTELIAQLLIRFGTAYYFLCDDSETEEMRLVTFKTDGVVRLCGRYLQIVPKHKERHLDRDNEERCREIRILEYAKVMRFELPRLISRKLSRQSKSLAVIDKHRFRFSELQPEATHGNPNPTKHFDFGVWSDTQERALLRTTRGTGWSGRSHGSSKRSEFFHCHRLIRFRRNQLVLRDDILRQISVELTRVGKSYRANFFVKISATDELPSVSHLDKLEAKLAREEVGFAEIYDYCLKR